MEILHCIPKDLYEQMKGEPAFGRLLLEKAPFIHCSSMEYFWRATSPFHHDPQERVLLVLETDRLDGPVQRDAFEVRGRAYTHLHSAT